MIRGHLMEDIQQWKSLKRDAKRIDAEIISKNCNAFVKVFDIILASREQLYKLYFV